MDTMTALIPEKNKKPGVCYAYSDDGFELPVIDITHPAFTYAVTSQEVSTMIDDYIRSLPKLPHAVIKQLAANSILLRGAVESAGTYMSGMMTYLNKLGPDMLGDAYATALDKRVAAGIMQLSFRLRKQAGARLAADGLGAALKARPNVPVHLINIAGGPAIDSLNALILLQKEHPEWLTGRSITVHVLDLDHNGPAFGARALAALRAAGGPLHGLDVRFDAIDYDWANPALLRELYAGIGREAAVVGSTEGGLFEFASNDQIVANLQVLHDWTPADFVIAGPVVRDGESIDPRLKVMEGIEGRPGIRFLGLAAFSQLAAQAGWTIVRQIDNNNPIHDVVCLKKA
jgi:hypothetical protein